MTDERHNLDSDLHPASAEAPADHQEPAAADTLVADADPETDRDSGQAGAPATAAEDGSEEASGEKASDESAGDGPTAADAPATDEVAEGRPGTEVADAGEREDSKPTADDAGQEAVASPEANGTDAPTSEATETVPAAEATAAEAEAPAAEAQAADVKEAGDAPPATVAEVPPNAASESEPPSPAAEQPAAAAAAATSTGETSPEEASAAQSQAAAGQPDDATAKQATAEQAKTEEPKAEEPKAEEPEDPALAELRQARETGTPVEGRVIGWNRGGFHVVVSGLTAFCPSSEMEVGRPKSPASYVEQSFPFKVIKVQKKGRRVVVSRAAILGEQRQGVIERLEPGTVTKGRVTSLPDFGAFVDLGGVEGLVHVSEISRSRVQHPKDALTLGQEVEVKVLKVEQAGERISLSIKDLEPDPWRGANERFGRGDRFSGKVLRRADFGLFIELEPEVEGLLHVSQLPPGKSFDDEAYQPGQAIEGWVREIEPKRQRISLSLREVPTEDPWKAIGQRFPEGESVEGVVESVAPFGVFIVLAPGVTGLLPNSQTGLPRGSNAARAFAPGQTVRVLVVSIDQRRKRISLGREGAHVEGSKNDLQDFKRREKERVQEAPTAMAAAFARLRGDREDD